MGRVPANEEPGAGRRPLTRRSHPGSLGTGDRAGLRETSSEPASERPPAAIRAACPLRGRTGAACRSVGGRPLGASHRLPRGPPRLGEVSVTSLPGRLRPARAVVAARAPRACLRSEGRRPWKVCVSSGRRPRARAPEGRRPWTTAPRQPPFICQLRARRLRARPGRRLLPSPLCRPFPAPRVRRFSWKRRCRL